MPPIPHRNLFGVSSSDFSLPVHVVVIVGLRMAVLPLLAQALVMLLRAFGGVLLRPLTWIPLGIYSVIFEIIFRSTWHSVMDD